MQELTHIHRHMYTHPWGQQTKGVQLSFSVTADSRDPSLYSIPPSVPPSLSVSLSFYCSLSTSLALIVSG